jgi:hypothetical protein
MLTLAERWEMRPHNSNPCKSVRRFPEPRRERFLTDAEFTRLGKALGEIEESARVDLLSHASLFSP